MSTPFSSHCSLCAHTCCKSITVLHSWLSGKPETVQGETKQLPLPWSCTEGALMQLIRARDPSGKGMQSVLALRLLMLLLHWNPAVRPTPEQVPNSCVYPHLCQSAYTTFFAKPFGVLDEVQIACLPYTCSCCQCTVTCHAPNARAGTHWCPHVWTLPFLQMYAPLQYSLA